jgi:hypothetical protein
MTLPLQVYHGYVRTRLFQVFSFRGSSVFIRAHSARRTVRPLGVVVLPPLLNDILGLREARDQELSRSILTHWHGHGHHPKFALTLFRLYQ